jgi:hypothetical protein
MARFADLLGTCSHGRGNQYMGEPASVLRRGRISDCSCFGIRRELHRDMGLLTGKALSFVCVYPLPEQFWLAKRWGCMVYRYALKLLRSDWLVLRSPV